MESGLAKGECSGIPPCSRAALGVSRALFCSCSTWRAPPRLGLLSGPHRAPDMRPHHNEPPAVTGRPEAELSGPGACPKQGALPLPRCPPPCSQHPTLVGPTSLPRSHTSQPSTSAGDLKPPCGIKKTKRGGQPAHRPFETVRAAGQASHRQEGGRGEDRSSLTPFSSHEGLGLEPADVHEDTPVCDTISQNQKPLHCFLQLGMNRRNKRRRERSRGG